MIVFSKQILLAFNLYDLRCIILTIRKQIIAFKKGTFAPPAPPTERQEGRLLPPAPLCGVPGQVCVTGVVKLPWRNHEVQNLRAYSILHVVAIKWIMFVQENIEPPSMSQRPRLSSSIISEDFSLATTIM